MNADMTGVETSLKLRKDDSDDDDDDDGDVVHLLRIPCTCPPRGSSDSAIFFLLSCLSWVFAQVHYFPTVFFVRFAFCRNV